MKKLFGPTKRAKKGVLDNIANIFVGLAVVMLVAVVVFLIMSETAAQTQVAADPNATAAIDSMQATGDDTIGWVPLIIIVIIGVLMISLIRSIRGR